MKLARALIEGYRSIAEPLTFTLDPMVTIVLGANDHGKSNILQALRHLNPDVAFGPEDLHWDMEDQPDRYPHIEYVFDLSDEDRSHLLELEVDRRQSPARERFEAIDNDS